MKQAYLITNLNFGSMISIKIEILLNFLGKCLKFNKKIIESLNVRRIKFMIFG